MAHINLRTGSDFYYSIKESPDKHNGEQVVKAIISGHSQHQFVEGDTIEIFKMYKVLKELERRDCRGVFKPAKVAVNSFFVVECLVEMNAVKEGSKKA